jgi:hypothetical protein
MARLTIIARFLVVLLVPMIAFNQRPVGLDEVLISERHMIQGRRLLVIMYGLYAVLFMYQLLFQVGYSPYVHMFFS